MYLKNAEYTLFSYFLSFEPSSEKWGFSSCVTAFNVRQVVLGLRRCTNIGKMLPTYVDDKKETVLSQGRGGTKACSPSPVLFLTENIFFLHPQIKK